MKHYLLPTILVISLAACDKPQAPKPVEKPTPKPVPVATPMTYAPLVIHDETWKKNKPQCKGNDCPYIEVELQQIEDSILKALIEKELVNLVYIQEKQPKFATINELSQYFWPKTEGQWNIYLQSKVLRQKQHLLVVELNSDTYLGGAHGSPVTKYLNINRQNQQILSLKDMLVTGQEQAFWALVKKLHQQWLKQNDLADPDLMAAWPFVTTDNIALGEQGIIVKYQAYAIAAYAFGQPEFVVPYSQLQGILKPEFF